MLLSKQALNAALDYYEDNLSEGDKESQHYDETFLCHYLRLTSAEMSVFSK